MLKRLAIAAAMTVAVVGGGTASAQAAQVAYADPQVAWVHNVKSTDDSATLVAKYRCWGGNEGTHLWVSLKQGGGISGPADELAQQEGTSAVAASWYDSHPENVVCNGKWQIQQFTVYREQGIPGYHPEAWKPLVAGPAFLQFCLFDSTAEAGPDADLSQGFGYLYSYVPVKTR
jgi:hypothetical protein